MIAQPFRIKTSMNSDTNLISLNVPTNSSDLQASVFKTFLFLTPKTKRQSVSHMHGESVCIIYLYYF